MKGLERPLIRFGYYLVVVNSIVQLAFVTFGGWDVPKWCVTIYLALLFQFSLIVASHQWRLAKMFRRVQLLQEAWKVNLQADTWKIPDPEPKQDLPVTLIKIRKADDDEYPS